MVFAMVLEGLQGLTPDRSPNLLAESTAQVGCWRRLCLLNCSSEYRGGVPTDQYN
jgi:hypothetical protein